jgi:PAS domain S-box-containing protein
MDLARYTLETLRVDREFILYRGTQAGNEAVLVLAPVSSHEMPIHLSRLEHEYQLANELDPSWAAKPLALARHGGRTALVLADPGGTVLEVAPQKQLGLSAFLELAIGITAALRKVHASGLIHKDVKPANVLLDVHRNVHLTGFGLATRLPHERQAPGPPEVIAGTLAYMAPEQTGRMNRSIDARSDLYSLGVTLYELITGSLPFAASDASEWIHCHVARQPRPPSERVKDIPGPVEAIILKLLAKAGEDRYQTARGLEHDLRLCLTQLQVRGTIEPFPLGSEDAPDTLVIPERLYGREAEVAALIGAFDRILTTGHTEFVLVSGYSGVGKSSLVNELHKVVARPRGLFATGKFDQYKRDIPYATLVQAFQSLVRELLGRSESELSRWREALTNALGWSGQLIVNLIPELTLIIGEQPAIPDLPPHEHQNRFHLVFHRFINVFARPEHPLALFLDDLQWADPASLELLERLVLDGEVRHLLLIGAYRDNETGPSHPLMRSIQVIRSGGGAILEIEVGPLRPDDVCRFVSDAVHADIEHVRPLAALVFEKTAGNPFFTIQFVTALAEEKLLTFESDTRAWRWDVDRIREKGFTDNVADLMAAKLSRLPERTQAALGSMACLGIAADFATLDAVNAHARESSHQALWDAVLAGLIFRLDSTYRFIHDRVQEAAYSLIPENERALAHLRIGRLLAARTQPPELEDSVFDVVSQFNRGVALIIAPEERQRVASLNLIAGKRAKAAAAYPSALQHFKTGLALLEDDAWDRSYALAFDLELNCAECEYLTGQLHPAEERLSTLAKRARSNVDLAAVTCIRVNLYTILRKIDVAVDVGLEYLRRTGGEWPLHVTDDYVQDAYNRLRQQLGSRPVEALVQLPAMSDPEQRATMDVLTVLSTPVWFTDGNLFRLLVCRMVLHSLERGNSDGSCLAYVWLGGVLGPYFNDYATGLRFGRLGFDLVEKRGLDRFRARVDLICAVHVVNWAEPLARSRALLQRAFTTAQEGGDLNCAAYTRVDLITNLIASGNPLSEVDSEIEAGLGFVRRASFGLVSDCMVAQQRLVRTLRGLTRDFGSFDDTDFDAREFERHIGGESAVPIAKCFYWIRMLQACVFAADYGAAARIAERVEPFLWAVISQFEFAEFHFYAAVARGAYCDIAPAETRATHLAALVKHYEQIGIWANNCPETFASRATLVGAELARLTGREIEAMRLYEDAVRLSREHGFVQNEALSNEFAARCYAGRGLQTAADGFLQNARDCYARWGADGKIRHMDCAHPHLARPPMSGDPHGTIGVPLPYLDVDSVVKVSQAISGEIHLQTLVDTLLRTTLEQSGAERGALVLLNEGRMSVEAEAVTMGEKVVIRTEGFGDLPHQLPMSILRFVMRTRESILLSDARSDNVYAADIYFNTAQPRSLLCLPLVRQGTLTGLLFLENYSASNVFDRARISMLHLIASQAAISIENARLYRDVQQAQDKARQAESELRLSFDMIPALAWSAAPDGTVEFANKQWHDFTGISPGRLTDGAWISAFHPDDAGRVLEKWHALTAAGSAGEIEAQMVRYDGETRRFLIRAAPMRDDRGSIVRWYGSNTDVDDLKRAERALRSSLREKEALLKEVHHRVKNNLQLISSLLSLQATSSAEPGVAERFAESRNRVRSMALVHENLYRAGDFTRIAMSGHVEALCAQLMRAYSLHDRRVNLTTDVDRVEFDLDRAIAVGLIINEMVSNALKHAFPGSRRGSVRVALKAVEATRFALSVADDGIGLPLGVDVGRCESMGLQLVHDLSLQLHGSVTVTRDRGTRFVITFSADGALPSGQSEAGVSS